MFVDCFLILRWWRYLKSILVKANDLFILHNQYLGCWWPGDIKSQGISSHGIDLLLHGPTATEELPYWGLNQMVQILQKAFLNAFSGINISIFLYIFHWRWQVITWTNDDQIYRCIYAGIILCMHPANERRRYNVTLSLIGWVHAKNQPCICIQQDLMC